MANKVYNKLILKGKAVDLKVLLDGCHGHVLLEDGILSTNTNLTFNSYIKINSVEEAIEKWGVAVDSLAYYDVSFDEADKTIELCKDNEECEVEISFQTYNGIVFKWVKEMAKANPDVSIKYYVVDRNNSFYSSCIFYKDTKNIEYKTERYISAPELEYKFLNAPLEEIMKYKISTCRFMLDTGKGDYEFKIEDVMDYLRHEFKFLSEGDFKALVDKVA